MTHRIGAKGQVVIPKDLRERTGLRPGANVEFVLDGRGVSIKAARGRPKKLGGLEEVDHRRIWGGEVREA
jgi:AbrB family looped-hinge helix DNA binding protein